MYDIRRLILMRDLADYGTIAAVSKAHGITSSAVSQQLRALEEEVGRVLLRREGRGLRLTYAGQVLVEHVEKVLSALDDAENAVAATGDALSGTVTIVGFQTIIATLGGPLFTRMRHEHPEFTVRLMTAIKDPAIKAVRRQEADIAITYTYSFGRDSLPLGIESEYLFSDPLVLLAPPGLHPEIAEHGLRCLADTPWIAGHDGAPSIESLVYNGRRAGFKPRIVHRIDGFGLIAELVAEGVGVAIVPKLAVPGHLVHLVADAREYGTRQVEINYRTGAITSPLIAAVVHALRVLAAAREAIVA